MMVVMIILLRTIQVTRAAVGTLGTMTGLELDREEIFCYNIQLNE